MDGFSAPAGTGARRSHHPGRRARRVRIGAGISLALAVVVGILSFAPAAFAHHSEITGSATCAQQVSWTASAWATTDGDRRVNTSVKVWYVVNDGPDSGATATVGTGAFLASNGYAFSGQFPWPSAGAQALTLYVQEQVGWGANQNLAGVSAPRSTVVTLPSDCPSTPSVSASVACADGDGVATLILSAKGGTKAVTFVVTDPVTKATTTKVVAPGATTSVTVGGLPDGQVTIPVTADGKAYDQSVTVTCDRPSVPKVSSQVSCTDGDGTVVVTLQSTGGDLPVTFTVTDPRTGTPTTVVVAPGETKTVTLTGVADGTLTIPVTAGGKSFDQTVTVSCDRPGVPSVSSKVECAKGDGTVVVTLSNTGGDLPVSFTVTSPVDGGTVAKTVAPGASETVTFTGLADGKVTVPIVAGSTHLDQTLTVACDEPGVASIQVSTQCSDFDGVVVLTLGNTGGTEPVAYEVTDPRTSQVTKVSVPVGGSQTVTLTGFSDGAITIPVTADGKHLDQTVTVACDRPGTPNVLSDVACTETGGQVTVTLVNTAVAGAAEPITFVVTDPRDGTTTTKVVAAGSSAQVVLDDLPEGEHTIAVSADGAPLAPVVAKVDCQQPEVLPSTIECVKGGFVVKVGNEGGTPSEVTVTKDGQEVSTVTVPATGTAEVLVPMDEGQTATIAVLSGDQVLQTITATKRCEDPATTTTTQPGGPTTSAPTQVLGQQVSAPTTTGGSLPYTGSNSLLLTGSALLLAVGGALLLYASRRLA